MVRLLVAATVGRTAVFLLPVGLFFAAASGEPAEARTLVGLASALTIGRGVALWPAGRVLDRIGPWSGLGRSIAAAGLLLAALAVGIRLAVPGWMQLIAAGMGGALTAPLVATPRALLPGLVAGGRLPQVSAWEAASIEVSLLAAPLIAAVVSRSGAVWVVGAAAAILAAAWAVMPSTGAAVTLGLGRSDGGDRLLTRAVAGLGGLAAVVGLSGGLLEPGLAALPPPLPSWPESAALLFVALGVGSLTGGIVAARVGWPATGPHALPLLVLHAVFLAAAADASGAARIAVLVVAGIPFAPLVSLGGLLLDRWVPPGRRSESFAMVAAALEVGTGVGQALAGHLLTVLDPANLVGLSAVPIVAVAATLVAVRRHRR